MPTEMPFKNKLEVLRIRFGEVVNLLPLWWLTPPEKRDSVFLARLTCCLDLMYLSRRILGYADLTVLHEGLCQYVQSVNIYFIQKALEDLLTVTDDEKVQKELRNAVADCRVLSAGVDKERMFLIFRGGFKTTLITECHSIQLTLIDPNIRILIASGNLNMASKMLRNIRNHYMYNKNFRGLFSEWCPKPNKNGTVEFGNSETFTLPNRYIYRKEGTMDAAGLETRKTGNHWDYMKKDDLINEQNCTNEDQIQKAVEFDQLSHSLADNPSRVFQDYIGTRYSSSDIYGHKQRLSADGAGEIDIVTYDHGRWNKKKKRVA